MKLLIFLGFVLFVQELQAETQTDPVCKGTDTVLFQDEHLPATLYRNNTPLCLWNSTGSRSKKCEKRVIRDEMFNIRLYNLSIDDNGIYTLISMDKTVGNKTLLMSDECNVPVIRTEENGIWWICTILLVPLCVLLLVGVLIICCRKLRKRQYSGIAHGDAEENGKDCMHWIKKQERQS